MRTNIKCRNKKSLVRMFQPQGKKCESDELGNLNYLVTKLISHSFFEQREKCNRRAQFTDSLSSFLGLSPITLITACTSILHI